VIVAVVVAYVASAWISPPPAKGTGSVPGVPVPARQDRANEPEDREDKADQAEDPVPLAEGHDGKGGYQN